MLSTNKSGAKDIWDFALLLGATYVYFSPQNIRSQDILYLLTTILKVTDTCLLPLIYTQRVLKLCQ